MDPQFKGHLGSGAICLWDRRTAVKDEGIIRTEVINN